MARRKLTAALFAAAAIASSTIGLNGTAAAHTGTLKGGTGILTSEEARQPSLTAAQMKNAVMPKAAGSTSAAAARTCPYYYVCGTGGNGNRFEYTTCSTTYTLPNLIGWGSLHNNQTPGTRANFYDANGAWMFSSVAPERNDVYWTPVWYVIAC
ncbi:hypothetical protein [Streptomyces sp. S.PB5]|uniref:hypothetical protein n=1 Tax=Streptomyces sp. S.PB5 TaxID=3020844 RepID=UPI0025B1C75B|nr:hypothetical protein [Streptomyces sp. S.PB5]MDN3027986.1 hypothetical protein [Streptomyces sp. S.PB5]